MKSVLVIDMPPTCYECPFAMWQYETLATSNKHKKHLFACVLTHKTITSTKRSRFCPLKPMPERRKPENPDETWEEMHVRFGFNECLEDIEK